MGDDHMTSPTKTPTHTGTIYLLRHGAIHNPQGGKRYLGWQDDPLNDIGLRQAHAWADYFSGKSLDAIYCSDLIRCLETARVIAARFSLEPLALTELREICLGEWEGRCFDEIQTLEPQEFRRRGIDIASHRPPGGESFADLQRRVWPLFTNLACGVHQTLLLVSHAGVIRVLLCSLLGIPLENLFRIGSDYGTLSIINFGPKGYRVQAVNLPSPI